MENKEEKEIKVETGNLKEKSKQKKKHTQELEEKIIHISDQLLRVSAEYDNFKKRETQNRIEIRKYASMDLIADLLVSLDQLRFATSSDVEDPKLKNYLIGFKMISNNIFEILKQDGLEEIDSLNKQFDPAYMHAVEKISDKEKENSIVLFEVQKGYKYKEKLLRPAMVKVNEWSD